MPCAIPMALRLVIVERHEAGTPLPQIARELGRSPWTVRTIWRRYRDGGAAALSPDYARCGHPGPRADPAVDRAACELRRHHPGWGAGLIRTLLVDRYGAAAVPHARTLCRWFAQAGLTTPRRRLRTGPAPPRATVPHQVWQLDAKEQIALADGTSVCWLTVTDEASGAILAAPIFPPPLLGAGRPPRRAGGAARRLCAVGLAGEGPGRQRPALGGQRSAD